MIPWLFDIEPFEVAWKTYLGEKPRIPEPFHPHGRLKEDEYSSPSIDQGLSTQEKTIVRSTRVHFEFSEIVDSLTHQSYSTFKKRMRSDSFQAFRAFVSPFLICSPHRPWNDFGGDVGLAISPRSLHGILRYRWMVDTGTLESDFDALGGCDPWKQWEFKHFTSFERFSSYFDRYVNLAKEAIDTDRVLFIGIY
jgi:hypothetical protein